MIRIGLNSSSLVTLKALEGGQSVQKESQIFLQKKRATSGALHVSGTGRRAEIYTITFDKLEKAEVDELLSYCSPFTFFQYYVELSNENEIIFEGLAYLEAPSQDFEYYYTRQSFQIKIYQINA